MNPADRQNQLEMINQLKVKLFEQRIVSFAQTISCRAFGWESIYAKVI